MGGFVDYVDTAPDEYIIVQAGDLFLHFNRAVEFNKDSAEMTDSIVIVRERSDGTDLLNGLGVGDSHSESIGGEDVTIEVCSVYTRRGSNAVYMLLSIGYGDSLCRTASGAIPNLTPSPTSRPTLEPTPNPTWRPSSHPTPRPTPYPTPHPTPRPTPHPTPRPFSGADPSSFSDSTPRPISGAGPARFSGPSPWPISGSGPSRFSDLSRSSPQPVAPAPTSAPNEKNAQDTEGQPQPVPEPPYPASGKAGGETDIDRNVPITPAPSLIVFDLDDSDVPFSPSLSPTSINFEGNEDVNGILTKSQPSEKGTKISGHLIVIVSMLIFGCCCCLLFYRYQIVWDDEASFDEELVEVGDDIVAIKRCQAPDNNVETATLTSDDASVPGLEGFENWRNEAVPSRGELNSNTRRLTGNAPQQKGFFGEDWVKALDFWTEPSVRAQVPLQTSPSIPQRLPPSRGAAPTFARQINKHSPARQSFQPVDEQSRARPTSWFDVTLDPLQTTASEPIEQRSPT